MSRTQRFDLAVLLLAAGFYAINRLWLRGLDGFPGMFFRCWANDIWAGAAILAWSDLLLTAARLPRPDSPGRTVPLLLACGLVWEVLAPLWNPAAVFDPLDLLAYQLGGALWLAGARHSFFL